MSERVWHKGPPPHIGWWEASDGKVEDSWRWWDGSVWSKVAWPEWPADWALDHASRRAYVGGTSPVEWTDYWPENARVPRLDPTGGHWTFNVDGQKPEGVPEWIDVRLRDPEMPVLDVHSGAWHWGLDGHSWDILAWRPAA